MKSTRSGELTTEEAKLRLSEIRKNDPAAAGEIEQVQRELVEAVLRTAVKDGALKVDGKSKAEAARAIVRFLKKCLRSKEFRLITDYKRTLLEEAKGASERNEHQVAVILLGTHFEHYLNELILAGCRRKKFSEGIAIRLIKTTPFSEKISPIPEELGLSPIASNVCGAVREIGKLRNELVHYRWEAKPEEAKEEHRKRIAHALKRGFEAAEEIAAYDEATFYAGWNRVSAADAAKS